jgi:sulfate/thiosulfate transport system substrate-binding protein
VGTISPFGVFVENGGEAAQAQKALAQHHYRPRQPEVAAKYDAQYPKLNLLTIDELFGGWQMAQAKHFSDGGVSGRIYTQ